MEEKKNLLTYAGLKKLEDELHDLKVVKRKEGMDRQKRSKGNRNREADATDEYR